MKIKRRFIFLSILFLLNSSIFSQSRTIRSLSFDLTFTEKNIHEETTSTVANIQYNFEPFIFIYTTTSPQNETYCLNPEGCFYKTNNPDSEYQNYLKGELILWDFCNELLSFFYNDYNLSLYYNAQNTSFENNLILTQWIKTSSEEDIYLPQYIDSYTDDKNRIIKINFLDKKKNLQKTIECSDFIYTGGFYFPQKVTQILYSSNSFFSQTDYSFSNIQLNIPIEKTYNQNIIEVQITKKLPTIQKQSKYGKIKTPAMTKYNVSFVQISSNLAFSFYKKFITNQDTSNCGYNPTCSQYMIQAINKNGLFGIIQGIDRLSRCTTQEHNSNLYPEDKNGKDLDPVP